jgi:hypothetical protein
MTLVAACSMLPSTTSMQSAHPEKLPIGRPLCTECHADGKLPGGMKPYQAFDHTPSFVADHRLVAAQSARVCSVCHAESFCIDCHAAKTEIKPSLLHGNRPDRDTVHQGDYLTRHRFDGKADPTGCYGCHGRANNDSCRRCHR